MSEYKIKFGSIINFLNFKRKPLSSKEREKRQGVYPYYGASDIVDYIDDYIFDGRYLLISEDGENLKTRKTPIAFVASGKFWVNNHAHIVSGKDDETLDYLKYIFSNLNIMPFLTGAVQPKLSKGILENIEINFPPYNKRKKINSILRSFDTKILLNTQTNQTLEQIAQALFKSWFVDFDPVKAKMAVLANGDSQEQAEHAAMQVISGKTDTELKKMQQTHPEQYKTLQKTTALFPSEMIESELGDIPKGWDIVPLSDFGDIICGKTPSKNNPEFYGDEIPFIKIPDMHNQVFITNTSDSLSIKGADQQNKKYIPKGSICVSCIATVGLVSIASQSSQTNQQINSIIPKSAILIEYLYLILSQEVMKKLLHDLASGGSATLNLNTGRFSKIKVIRTTDKLLKLFHHILEPIFEKILSNSTQNNELIKIRDNLLPKLLSGEIDILNENKE